MAATMNSEQDLEAILAVDSGSGLSSLACTCSVFSISKSQQVLQKAQMKIVGRVIYNDLFFLIQTLLFCCKIKSCCDHCFPQQIRPQTTNQLYMLQDYSSVRTGFSMNSKMPHTAYSTLHVSLNIF